MKLLKENLIGSKEVMKSRFLTYIYQVENEGEVKEHLKALREENPGARHIVYTYLLPDFKMGASEDKEPVNSAHRILNTLKMKDMAGLACFVVRYYGGVQLGASNLDRTYVSCVFDLITDEHFGERIVFQEYEGTISNNCMKAFEKEVDSAGGKVLNKEYFGPSVKIRFGLQKDSISKLIRSYFTDLKESGKTFVIIV